MTDETLNLIIQKKIKYAEIDMLRREHHRLYHVIKETEKVQNAIMEEIMKKSDEAQELAEQLDGIHYEVLKSGE